MENNDIIIRKAILHVLDSGSKGLVLSGQPLDLAGEQFDFLRKIVEKIHKNDTSSHAVFFEEESQVYRLLTEMNESDDESFVETTQSLARLLYNTMTEGPDIPPADLICTSFQEENQIYLAILKLNYKSSYTQEINGEAENTVTSIVKNCSLLPEPSTKPSEAAIINLSDMSICLVEKKYEINGEKVNYFSEMFLCCTVTSSAKKRLSILTRCIDSVCTMNTDNIESQMDAKALLHNEFVDNKNTIDVEEVSQKLFGDYPEIKASFDEKMESYDMQFDKIEIQNESTAKKLETIVIVVENGIEISIPVDVYNKKADVEIKQNSFGSSEIHIKNIEKMRLK